MCDRVFVCRDCRITYTMTYETKTGAANARRTRCPKCQRVHELLRKRKKGSEIDFQEVETKNSILEPEKSEQESEDIVPELPIAVEEPEPDALIPDQEGEIEKAEDLLPEEVQSEVNREAYTYKEEKESLLASMGKRISIMTKEYKDDNTSLRAAIAYGRSYRKQKE